jgi:hypothetical protein
VQRYAMTTLSPMERLADLTPPAQTTIDMTGFTTWEYNSLELLLIGIRTGGSTNNATLQLYRNYSLVTSGYSWAMSHWNNSTVNAAGGTSQSAITWTAGGLSATKSIMARFHISQNDDTLNPHVIMSSSQPSNANVLQGVSLSGEATGGIGFVSGIRLIAPVAFNTIGRILLFGLR